MQRSALCRSRRELSNTYFLAKIRFDTAENEPCKVCPIEPSRSHDAFALRLGERAVNKKKETRGRRPAARQRHATEAHARDR